MKVPSEGTLRDAWYFDGSPSAAEVGTLREGEVVLVPAESVPHH